MTACPLPPWRPCGSSTAPTFTMEESLPMISPQPAQHPSSVLVEVPESWDVGQTTSSRSWRPRFSSPTYEVLKRSDEAKVVLQAHLEPKFVEDVVRTILAKVLERYPDLPDETLVTARSESEESIHKHNAFAERVSTLGDIRAGA